MGGAANSIQRLDRLFTALKLDKVSLTEQFHHLEELINENSDLFVLHDLELGRTKLVEYRVDTGLIKQPVRRIPFVYRDKVATMVEDMKHPWLIQPSSLNRSSLIPKLGGTKFFLSLDLVAGYW